MASAAPMNAGTSIPGQHQVAKAGNMDCGSPRLFQSSLAGVLPLPALRLHIQLSSVSPDSGLCLIRYATNFCRECPHRSADPRAKAGSLIVGRQRVTWFHLAFPHWDRTCGERQNGFHPPRSARLPFRCLARRRPGPRNVRSQMFREVRGLSAHGRISRRRGLTTPEPFQARAFAARPCERRSAAKRIRRLPPACVKILDSSRRPPQDGPPSRFLIIRYLRVAYNVRTFRRLRVWTRTQGSSSHNGASTCPGFVATQNSGRRCFTAVLASCSTDFFNRQVPH